MLIGISLKSIFSKMGCCSSIQKEVALFEDYTRNYLTKDVDSTIVEIHRQDEQFRYYKNLRELELQALDFRLSPKIRINLLDSANNAFYYIPGYQNPCFIPWFNCVICGSPPYKYTGTIFIRQFRLHDYKFLNNFGIVEKGIHEIIRDYCENNLYEVLTYHGKLTSVRTAGGKELVDSDNLYRQSESQQFSFNSIPFIRVLINEKNNVTRVYCRDCFMKDRHGETEEFRDNHKIIATNSYDYFNHMEVRSHQDGMYIDLLKFQKSGWKFD